MKLIKIKSMNNTKLCLLLGSLLTLLLGKRLLISVPLALLHIILTFAITYGMILYVRNYEALKKYSEEKSYLLVFEALSGIVLGAGSYYVYTSLPGYQIHDILLYVCLCLFIFAYLVCKNRGYFITDSKEVIKYTVLAITMVVLCQCIYYFPTNEKRVADYVGSLFLLGIGASYLCNLFQYKRLSKWRERHPVLAGWLMFTIATFLSFATLETLSGNFVLTILPLHWIMNMVWFFLISGVVIIIFKSKKGALLGSLGVMTLIGLVNGFILLFRGSPILPADLLLIETAMEVSGNYSFRLPYYMYIGVAVMLFTIFFILRIKEQKLSKKEYGRFAFIYTAVLLLVVPTYKLNAELLKGTIDLWRPVKTYRQYGTLNGFGINLMAMQMKQPEGYSSEAVTEILSQYESDEVVEGELPNIIVVMCEAFSDLSVVGDFETNSEVLPYLTSLKENVIKGTTYASVLGGTTANSEYEFLTGNSMSFMPMGSVPYQQYIQGETSSLVSTLGSLGYSKTALHSYARHTYRRELVYPMLGFDEYFDQSSFENPVYLRDFISDQSDFEKVIELYEGRDKEKPFFIHNVTMQNHSSYNSKKMDYNITLKGTNEFEDANEYLSCVNHTDQALKTLIDYFSSVEKPTYIVFFGDHQPNLDSGFFEHLLGGDAATLSNEELQKRYQVPFFIWSNQDIEEKAGITISTNYLSSLLLKTAGLPMTAYNKYLMDLYEEYPVININGYIDAQGNHYEASAISENQDLVGYNMLVYHSVINNSAGVEWAYQLKTPETEVPEQ